MRISGPLPFRDRRHRLESLLEDGAAPVFLTPLTLDIDEAKGWFTEFEGAGLDGIVAKHPDSTYQPGKRVMAKLKHDRTADCVVVGYRTHKSSRDAVGSLLLAVYADEAAPVHEWETMFGGLIPIGVAASFPAARRRELFTELAPYVVDLAEHPWAGVAAEAAAYPGSRWNPEKDLSFTPLRPELVAEVRFNQLDGGRLRHPAQFLRWRPDRDPLSCRFDQLEATRHTFRPEHEHPPQNEQRTRRPTSELPSYLGELRVLGRDLVLAWTFPLSLRHSP